jgi:SAM-dependent methyltransferase
MSNSPHADIDRPSAWVARFLPLMPAGEVLDLACGNGRHARLAAQAGHPVLALDRDPQALARAAGAGIRTVEHDLEQGARWPFEDERFAGVIVTNYLHRPLFAALCASLMPGGVLIYETFGAGNERYGRPARADFLLRPGELLDVAASQALRVLAYEDGYLAQPRPALVQRICAARPGADLRLESIPLT